MSADWINIADRLPEVGANVVVYRPLAHLFQDDTITILRNEGSISVDLNGVEHTFERNHFVSHWMPLPGKPCEDR